ncbi:DUF222 domain-containing protein [Nakamurella sp.]|uniref:HNH endonuclease n=1 Tax=Nakamurella sp. TaxID=1869182 RepID=UPI00378437FA
MSSTEQAVALIATLAALDTAGTNPELIDEITALEQLKTAISARQARLTDTFAVSQRAELTAAGVKPVDARRSVCAQIALARRDSPHKGNRHVGLAHTLVHEMPQVLHVLERGDASEWRATLIARETAHLSVEHRARIDAAIADQLPGWSDQHTAHQARGWAHRLDPQGAADRASKAVTDRRVTIRPAPDCMTYLTALLPMKEGVGVYGVLHRAAMTAHCDPDDHRSKGQVMADELVKRTMTPGAGEPEHPAVELHLVMTDRALADRDDEPAHLIGHGPVPAPIARDLLTADERTRVWVRRLFTDPGTGDLLATDARRRDFPPAARQFLAARDQICRTPWCGAPIREADHAVAVSKGGPTDLRNGNGRCTNCNLVKDLDGWTTRVDDTGVITTTTPTGHTHHGRPPNPPKSAPWEPRPRIRRPDGTGEPAPRIEIHWPGEMLRSRQ